MVHNNICGLKSIANQYPNESIKVDLKSIDEDSNVSTISTQLTPIDHLVTAYKDSHSKDAISLEITCNYDASVILSASNQQINRDGYFQIFCRESGESIGLQSPQVSLSGSCVLNASNLDNLADKDIKTQVAELSKKWKDKSLERFRQASNLLSSQRQDLENKRLKAEKAAAPQPTGRKKELSFTDQTALNNLQAQESSISAHISEQLALGSRDDVTRNRLAALRQRLKDNLSAQTALKNKREDEYTPSYTPQFMVNLTMGFITEKLSHLAQKITSHNEHNADLMFSNFEIQSQEVNYSFTVELLPNVSIKKFGGLIPKGIKDKIHHSQWYHHTATFILSSAILVGVYYVAQGYADEAIFTIINPSDTLFSIWATAFTVSSLVVSGAIYRYFSIQDWANNQLKNAIRTINQPKVASFFESLIESPPSYTPPQPSAPPPPTAKI